MLSSVTSSQSDKNSKPVPLRLLLLVPFLLQIFAIVGLTGWLSFRNGQQAVNNLATQLQNEVSARTKQKLDTYLATPHLINQLNADAGRVGILNPQDLQSLQRYFWKQMQAFENISYIYYGSEQGKFIGIERHTNGSLSIQLTDELTKGAGHRYGIDATGNRTQLLKITAQKYDPRQRPWYTVPRQTGKPTWSEIYSFFDAPKLTISANQPFYDSQNQLRGVLGADLVLEDIGKFLRTLKVGKSGQTFIIEDNGLLVASSSISRPFRITAEGQIKRISASQSSDPLMQKTAEYLSKRFGSLDRIQAPQQLKFMLNGEQQFLQIVPFEDQWGLDWLIVVVVPKADFMGEINANTRTTIILCIIALIVATVVGIVTSRWISNLILRLGRATQAIANGQLQQKIEITGISELRALAQSFSKMTAQLQASFTAIEKTNAELEKRVEERTASLAAAEAELRAIFRAMTDVVIIFDAQGRYLRFLSVIPSFIQFRGKTPEEQIGLTLHDFLPQEQADTFISSIQQVLNTQRNLQVEYSLQADNQLMWFSASISPFTADSVIWVARDISARKRVEEENRFLLTITKAITEASNLDAALEVTLRQVCQAIGWNYGEAWIPDSAETYLERSDGCYACDGSLEQFCQQSQGFTFAPNVGLPGRVWSSRQPEWITDVSVQPSTVFLRPQLAREAGLKAAFAVPILGSGEVLAVLVFFKFTASELDQRVVDLVSAIASQLSSLIQRKLTVEALRRSEAQKRAILLAIPDLIMRINREGYYLDFIQPKFSQMSAIEDVNPTGKHLSDGFPPELYRRRMFYIERALETGEVQIYEQQVEVNNQLLDEEVRVVPTDENEVLILVRDVTARKQAEEALRQAEEKYRSIFENATEGIFQTTPEGHYLSANLALAKIYGYHSPEELIGSLTNIQTQLYVDPTRRSTFVETLEKNGFIYDFESQVYRQDGSILWISENARVVCDSQGNLRYYEGTVTDITRRKLAEDALRKSEKQLRLQNKVLVRLTKHPAITQGNLSAALKTITKSTARLLGVERVSVWLYDKRGSRLQCLNLFERSCKQYSEGMELNVTDYPIYSQAIKSGEAISADDARTHPKTKEFTESYFIPLNIFSMLDAPIRQSGQTVGVVCLEQVGSIRHWIPEEENFVRSIADVVALALESQERKLAEQALRLEQEKSEQLLLNILPEVIADQLKRNRHPIADHFENVTILFADIVGFTPLSMKMPPIELVNLLNEVFSQFDQLAGKYGLEKIKTIGDAYMVVGGLPVPREDHAEAVAEMALEMQATINGFRKQKDESLQIRIGINTGQVVAGVIGMKKFIYDLWGDAVNVASRMESSGVPGGIQVTAATYEYLKDKYLFEERGLIAVKGKGKMTTYWLIGKML